MAVKSLSTRIAIIGRGAKCSGGTSAVDRSAYISRVYPVSSDRWFTMADYPAEDFPIFPKYYRIDDKNASGTDKTYQEYVSLGGTDKEEAFNKRRNRIGFVKADHYDADEYQLLSKLVGTYLTDDYLKNQTSPYNFRVDSKGQLHFYDFASWVKE